MIIVSDSTPLHYLIEIEKQDVLKELFGALLRVITGRVVARMFARPV